MSENQRLLARVAAMPRADVQADFESAAGSYLAQLEAAKEAGFDLTNTSRGNDASDMYLDLAADLAKIPPEVVQLFQDSKGERFVEAASPKFDAIAQILDGVQAAARIPLCTFDIGQTLERPAVDLPTFRRLAKLTTSASTLMLLTGNVQAFATYLETACRMSNQLEGTPSLISALVQSAQVTIVTRTSEQALKVGGHLPNVRDAVSLAMGLLRPAVFSKELLAGEYLFGAEMLDADPMKLFTDPGDDPSVIPDVLRDLSHNVVRDAGKARVLACAMETNAVLEASSGKPAVDRHALIRDVPSRWQKASGAVDAFAGISIAKWTEIFPATVKGAVRVGLTQSLVALCTVHAEKGAYPDRLPDQCPVDPFSLQPFRYRRKGQGFALYSVGENGKDDGGDSKLDVPTSLSWL